MRYDVLYNFISPVTGYILATTDYVLVGNNQGIAIPSPILIDIRLDLIQLRYDFDSFAVADFVIGFPNSELPNAQVLNALTDGVMYSTAGIVSTVAIPDVGAPANATYILQMPDASLPDAQALTSLVAIFPYALITKVVADGVVATAIPFVDYWPTTSPFQQLADTAQEAADAADESADIAGKSRTIASTSKDVSELGASISEFFAEVSSFFAAESVGSAETAVEGAAASTTESIIAFTAQNEVNESIEETLAKGALTTAAATTSSLLCTQQEVIAAEAAVLATQSSEEAVSIVSNAESYLETALTEGVSVLPINGNINMKGFGIKNLTQSPINNYDAVGFTFLWDLFQGKVQVYEI